MKSTGNSVMEIGQKLYTVEEFEVIADAPENRDRLLELINGEIIEKVPTFKHGMIVINIGTELNLYVRHTKSGIVVTEVRYRKPEDQHNARQPDISYYAGNRPMPVRGSVPYPPDLVVEVKSPDNSLRELREKARFYLANGTKLVWLINPEKLFVEVYDAKEDIVLSIDDVLTGGDVLPGFSMRVRDIFANPSEE